MRKTYEQRLAEMATELAKEMWNNTYSVDFDSVRTPLENIKNKSIENHKPLAAIALKHMADAFLKGYESGVYDANGEDKPLPLSEQLQSLGLIQPQKP